MLRSTLGRAAFRGRIDSGAGRYRGVSTGFLLPCRQAFSKLVASGGRSNSASRSEDRLPGVVLEVYYR
jgi:hypothetical protein